MVPEERVVLAVVVPLDSAMAVAEVGFSAQVAEVAPVAREAQVVPVAEQVEEASSLSEPEMGQWFPRRWHPPTEMEHVHSGGGSSLHP